jgi:hypothetical protein
MWSRTKSIIQNLNTLKNMKKKQNKMKIIKLVTAYFVLFSLSIFNANAQQLLTIEDAVKMH